MKRVWWCIVSRSAMGKDWCAISKVKVTQFTWSQNDRCYFIFWNSDSFATKPTWMVYWHKPLVKRLWVVVFTIKVTAKVKFCPDCMVWASEPFVTKLGKLRRYEGGVSSWAGLSLGKFGLIFPRSRSQWGQHKRIFWSNKPSLWPWPWIYAVGYELLIVLRLKFNLVWCYTIMSWSVLWNVRLLSLRQGSPTFLP